MSKAALVKSAKHEMIEQAAKKIGLGMMENEYVGLEGALRLEVLCSSSP